PRARPLQGSGGAVSARATRRTGRYRPVRAARVAAAMFDHVTIRFSERDASERFYETVLSTLGIEQTSAGQDFTEWDDFSLSQADDEDPVTRRLHLAVAA